MTPSQALVIIADLAQGSDPITGCALPADNLYQHPEIIRALFIAADALAKIERRQVRVKSLPPQAGKSWNEAEDQQLCEAFDKNLSVKQLMQSHQRTRGAIESRLAKFGRVARPIYRPRK